MFLSASTGIALPEGFSTMVTSTTTTMLDVVKDIAGTIVETFPLNLAVVSLIIGIGVGLYRRLKK